MSLVFRSRLVTLMMLQYATVVQLVTLVTMLPEMSRSLPTALDIRTLPLGVYGITLRE